MFGQTYFFRVKTVEWYREPRQIDRYKSGFGAVSLSVFLTIFPNGAS